jgi:AcrR family transcriptional regulator
MSQNSAPRERDPEARRERLLLAAMQVFARDGFDKGSLRQICLKARANLASVKYYFGDKKGLYREVLVESHRRALEHEPQVTLSSDMKPEETLRLWIRFCLRFILLKRASNPVLGQLVAHEMRQPTACLGEFLKLVVRPFHEELHRIIAAVLRKPEPDMQCEMLAHHIVGLCVHFDHGRVFIDRLGPPVPKTEPDIERLASGIADFALHALAGLRADAKK